jgi:type IV pilus assembly protein PilQ
MPVESFASIGSIGGWNGRASDTPARYTDLVRAVLIIAWLAHMARPAVAGDFCKDRGTPIDLDVKDADIHDVFRLIADVAKVNLVVSDEVTGKVTLTLKRVPWQAAACAIAKVEHVTLSFDGRVLLVTKR